MRRCLALFAIPLAACATDTLERRGPVVRDSAGIRIMENTAPLWTDAQVWHLSPEPVVNIGGGDTEKEQLFRVAGALRLDNGWLVVGNAGTHELRFYDESGAYVNASGGEGDGPGEFQRLYWLQHRTADSIVTYDLGQLRVSVFDSNGRPERTVTLRPSEEAALPVAQRMFEDGSFLAVGATSTAIQPTDGVSRRDASAYWYSATGDSSLYVGTYPGFEIFEQVRADGRFGRAALFFGRMTHFVVGGNVFYVADNARYEIQVVEPSGSLTAVVRKRHDPVPITSADIELVHERRLAEFADEATRQRMRRWYREIPEPENFPAFSAIQVDRIGNLWIQHYNSPTDDVPRWDVFDEGGLWLGTVTMPLRFSPLDIGPDYVLGLWRDADDVEHVRMYELVKP